MLWIWTGIPAGQVSTAVKALHEAFALGEDAVRREEPTGTEHRPAVRPSEDEDQSRDGA